MLLQGEKKMAHSIESAFKFIKIRGKLSLPIKTSDKELLRSFFFRLLEK